MLFNSFIFVFLFLPLSWIGFHVCARINHRLGVGWLVAASLFFYGWWTPAYLILLCGSIVFNYAIGAMIQRTAGKPRVPMAVLTAGVAANLLLLGYYKYFFPLLHGLERFGLHAVPAGAGVMLPLGISFFTFTQIGYLVDCKAGLTSGRRFLDYALFVTFFPHLIAGPILHHREMMPQYEKEETWRFRLDNFAVGLSIFFIGLAKKDIVADYFSFYSGFAFSHPGALNAAQAWGGALTYSLQLYFDFSGYSDMAIGLALLFNIRFPANFDSPYQCGSIIDFWQRWHMTLTRYLNLYIYNPIALWVSRRRTAQGRPVGRAGLRTVSGFVSMVAFPIFATLILIGVWHGAGFQFFLFGLMHAVYLTVNHLWRLLFHKKNAPPLTGPALWLSTAWKVGLTYLCVLVSQIIFRAPSTHAALAMMGNLLGNHPQAYPVGFKFPVPVIAAAFALVWIAPNVLQIFAPWNPSLTTPHRPAPAWFVPYQWKPNLAWGIALGLLAFLAVMAVGGQTEFLYFRF